MRPLVLSLAAALFGAAAAHATSPYPVNIERQRGETLIIEHTPVPARMVRKVIARRCCTRARSAA